MPFFQAQRQPQPAPEKGTTGSQMQASCWAFAHLMMWLEKSRDEMNFLQEKAGLMLTRTVKLHTHLKTQMKILLPLNFFFYSALVNFQGADPRQRAGPPQASEKLPCGMRPGGTKPPGDGE